MGGSRSQGCQGYLHALPGLHQAPGQHLRHQFPSSSHSGHTSFPHGFHESLVVDYNPTWSSTYVTNLDRIFLIQKRIVRAITNAPYRAHSAPIFAQLKLLDIYKLNSFYTAKFMFSYTHSLLPPPFLHLFNRNNNFHNYNTRTASNYRPHICRTDIKQFTILYQGPKLFTY